MSKQSTNFTVTNFNLNTEEVYLQNTHLIKFIAFGLEKCATTGTQHHQCFVIFHSKKSTGARSLNAIGKMFGQKIAHVEPMLGSFQQNQDYCSKDGVYTELGEKPAPGQRNDLMEISASILNGTMSVDCVCTKDPSMFHMYGRTLNRLETIAMRRKWRIDMTTCKWYWGKTGVGKSHRAFEGFSPETHFVKDLTVQWWDGYKQQDVVILNEFRGQMSFSFLLSLCDKWPLQVPIRGQESIPFISKHIIITSSVHPKDIYINVLSKDESFAQLERRVKIKELIKFNP